MARQVSRVFLGGIPENVLRTLPEELREQPEELAVDFDKGLEGFDLAFQVMMSRFAGSSYCRPDLVTGKAAKNPEKCVSDSVHSLIANFLANEKIFPPSPEGRPLGVPEIALVLGAAIGASAAAAYEDKHVTLEQIEEQLGIAWVAMREWLPRGVLFMRRVREDRKRVRP
jgi:hypothetical protein